jgi:hypothetical protein
MAVAFTPYSTVAEFFGQKPAWISDPLDQARVQAYAAYEQMYWNSPDTFKISLRGTNNLPIYVPSARTIVDTTNRYVGADFSVAITGTSEADVAAARLAIADFMKRERFLSRFQGAKQYGLIQGDWIWHVTADESKEVGKRLRITALDPSLYFPVPDPEDVDRTIAIHLAHVITTEDGEQIRRLTYRKTPAGRITVEEALFLPTDWFSLDAEAQEIIRPVAELAPEITAFPVYHTKNTEEPGHPFGSSELRGLERVMGAVNQTMSDEDLALALMGIGMWATDASHPIDPVTKKQVPWQLGPGRVVHHDGTKFDKVAGVGSLAESYGAHYDRLWQSIFQASSTPEIAVGTVDVAVASSGAALQLQLGPMISKAEVKNRLVKDAHDQLFYGIIHMWMPAYEQTSFAEDVTVDCQTGSAVPVNREERFTELNDMLDRGIITAEFYRTEAAKLGYRFPEGMGAEAQAEFEKRTAMSDGFADRVAEETGQPDE